MTIYHKHHIIPRHMGGTEDPENLVTVTIEQHAELHRQLWEDLGYWQDHVAWKMLSGQINSAEAIKLAQSEGAKNRRKRYGSENHFYGKKHSNEVKKGISEKKKGSVPPNKGVFGADNRRSRLWKIITPSGEVLIVRGLAQFCRENGLYYQAMGQVAKSKLKQHKGYKCEEIV